VTTRRHTFVGVVVPILLLAACGNPPPTSPSERLPAATTAATATPAPLPSMPSVKLPAIDATTAAADLSSARTWLASATTATAEPPLQLSGTLAQIQAAVPSEVAVRQQMLQALETAVASSPTVSPTDMQGLTTVLSGDDAALPAIASAVMSDTTATTAAADAEKLSINLRIYDLARVQTYLVLANDALAAGGSALHTSAAAVLAITPPPAPAAADMAAQLAAMTDAVAQNQAVESLNPASWINAPQILSVAETAASDNAHRLSQALSDVSTLSGDH
jgi:hypothetical protein